jgi:hypothetical protein
MTGALLEQMELEIGFGAPGGVFLPDLAQDCSRSTRRNASSSALSGAQ